MVRGVLGCVSEDMSEDVFMGMFRGMSRVVQGHGQGLWSGVMVRGWSRGVRGYQLIKVHCDPMHHGQGVCPGRVRGHQRSWARVIVRGYVALAYVTVDYA